MSLSDWIISLSGAALAIIISIAAYFIQKWIQQVDETLKEHSTDLKALTSQIISLKQTQDTATENISTAIYSGIAKQKIPFSKIESLEIDVKNIKNILQKDMLPKVEETLEIHGKVILLESSLRQHEQTVASLFKTVKLLVQKNSNQK